MDQETNSNAKTGQGQVLLPSNCVSLQAFIKKLGHDVEEIRVRAFKNILFKLDHKLVCAADLVQEKKLLINLLEWFNFPNAPMKKEVLRILKTLSKPVSGAKGLLSIGAIEFLSHLRQDVDPELYQSVDNVIHQLLTFPQEDAAGHDQRCLYKEHNPVEQFQDHSGSEQSSGHPGSNRKQAKEQSMQSVSPVTAQPFALKNGIHPHYDTKSATGFFEEQKGSGEKAHSSAISAIKIQSLHGTENSSRSFNESQSNLTFVPWMPLSTSDRNILSVTASRLQSRSQSLISNSCEFLRDVLFKDFPAEIFLQRPSLLQSLLEFLEDKTHVVDDPSVVLAVTQCLCDLSCHLHVRLKSLSDSVLFCHDQDCWKHRHIMAEIKNKGSDGQLVDARETGDGGDSDKSSSSSLSDNKASQASDEDDDNEDETVTEALQFNQLSLEEFCMIVLSRVTPVFKGSLCNVPSIIESSINLLHEVLSLMKNFFPANLWMSRMQVNSVMATSLTNIMKILGESIVHHMKYYIQLFPDDDKERDFKPLKHRLLVHRMTVVNLSTFLLQFLESLVPLEMSSKVIPSELTTVLWFLSMDELLAKTHNHLQPIAMKYLAAVDQHSNELSLFTEDICESMVNTCKFLKACKVKELGGSLKELADLLEASVPSLTYHRHMEFIHEALMICSKVCDPATVADERVIAVCQRAVLHLLAHSNSDVRWQAYKVSWSLAKGALSVSHVTEPMSIVCQKSLFLLDKAVLHQICCFGIYDENEKVSDVAIELITTLLLGRLSMSGELWKKLLHGLIPSLPQLQGSVLVDPTLDQCIQELVAANGVTGGHVTAEGDTITLPTLERLRGALRLMFVKDAKLRNKAFDSVIWNLANEANGKKKQLFVHGSHIEKGEDLFIVDQVTTAVHSHLPVSHTSVDKSQILNLLSILSSSPMDVAVRKSSAQQLAIILQDPQWHESLLEECMDEVCVSILLEIIEEDAPVHSSATPCPRVELVPACLTILRLLAEYNATCRHKLATKYSVYTLVTRCALFCQSNGQVKYEAACLMVLLLFDEAAVTLPDSSNGGISFSLPKSVVRRFQLPFTPPVHTPVSVHQSQGLELKNSLTSEPSVSRLRLAWNIGWHETIENLARVKGVEDVGNPDQDLGYWPALRWRDVDADLLCCSHITISLNNQLQCMESASSHYDVKMALSNITAHLQADKGATDGMKQRLAVEALYTLKWESAFGRFLQVVPNNAEDDTLATELLKLLDVILTGPPQPPEPVVAWVARTVLERDGPQMTLLRNVETSTEDSTVSESKRTLRKHLLSFLVTLVRCLSQYTKGWRLDKERIFIGDLAYALALNLDLEDNPQFYDIPVLETSLVCLAHISAQPHWSLYCKFSQGMSLCVQLMTSLVQIVLAFHAGRFGASLSFMGKGVTYYAGLCLCHLTQEMAAIDSTQAWVSHWLHKKDPDEEPLPWLVPLLTDRWPDVRWIGLSICTSLASSKQGRRELENTGKKFVGGLWSCVFTILLDDLECGFVRQQAALLLCSLVSGETQSNSAQDTKPRDKAKSNSKGIQVLLSLLGHFKFFQKVANILTNSALPLRVQQGTSSRACQSSATVSISSGTNADIPYKPLGSTSQSQSGSVSSEAQAITSDSANGKASPGVVSVASHTSSTILSGVSTSAPDTQPSRTPTSLVPLINERGLPSGMSSASGSTDVGSSEISSAPFGSSLVATGTSVTPGLIGALAKLMHNLALQAPEPIITALNKAQILSSIIDHIEFSEVQSFLAAEDSVLRSRAANVVIEDTLSMYSDILNFLHTVVRLNTIFCFSLLQDSAAIDRIVKLFSLRVAGEDENITSGVFAVWESVSRLFVTLLQKQGHLSVPSVLEENLYRHWSLFTDLFKGTFLESNTSPQANLKKLLLTLLGLLVTLDGKESAKSKDAVEERGKETGARNRMAKLLDSRLDEGREDCVEPFRNTETADERIGNITSCSKASGSDLCAVLLRLYDCTRSSASDVLYEARSLTSSVLGSVLALSQSAKHTALQGGLVETCLEQVKHLHVQMNMNSLNLGKGPAWKKEDPMVTELIKVLQLLRNFIYCSASVKAACLESGIVDVLHKLWSWCTVETSLLVEVLRLLSALTAQFPKASARIAGSTGVPGSVSRSLQSGSTFLHGVIKLTNKTISKLQNGTSTELDTHLAVFRAIFNLLNNAALSAECRGILWKTNFLQPFSSLKPLKSGPNAKQRSISRGATLCWLGLLVNLTFFSDGQQGVVKTPGAVEGLLDLSTSQAKQLQEKALLVLRNLCFHGASKPVLLVNEKLLSLLVDYTTNASTYLRALCLSALCALLHNCQKAKVSLKKAGIVNKLDKIKLLQEGDQPSRKDKYSLMCRDSVIILQEIFSDQG
ncbi:rotatin-like isoform X1 [Montipora capricornis]|uniref:rotatin-like isoform X1 n=1 Tax=Montipora capricornis TaxID=246305 RepID=UPI0035F2022B